jgi:hypothetical protein
MLSIYQEFETVIAKLEQEQIPYALCGGLAVGLHTEPRATKDIDILLLAKDVESVKKTLLSCGFKFFSTPMHFADSQIELHKLTKIEPGGKDYLHLDLLVIKSPPWEKVWQNRQRLLYKDQPIWVVSREWLIWMKMLRGSPQDLVDIENLKKTP